LKIYLKIIYFLIFPSKKTFLFGLGVGLDFGFLGFGCWVGFWVFWAFRVWVLGWVLGFLDFLGLGVGLGEKPKTQPKNPIFFGCR
jgi:hypothetical protein